MIIFIKRKRNISLAAVLLVAGITHLISPQIYLPAMPNYLPFHLELVYLTGIIEIILETGIILKSVDIRLVLN